MHRLRPLYVLSIGLLLVAGSFVYDILFAGIPYQDPPPGLAASYEYHASIAALIARVGWVVLAIGLLLLLVRKLRRSTAG